MSDNKNQAQLPLFTIIYEDRNHFVGGTSYYKTRWLESPLKKIKRVFFKLPTNDYMCLDKCDKYFYMVEEATDWMKVGLGKIEKLNSKPVIEHVYFIGKRADKVICYRVTLFNRKNVIIKLSLKTDKGIETKNYSLESRFFVKNRETNTKRVKVGDEVSVYNYHKRIMEKFKVTNKEIIIQSGRYHVGDITSRVFNETDNFVKKLNPNNWR